MAYFCRILYVEGDFPFLEKEKNMIQKQYFTLKNDIIFKNTFNNEESLKRLLSETLDLKVKKYLKIILRCR